MPWKPQILHSINWLSSVTEKWYVSCEVRTGVLYPRSENSSIFTTVKTPNLNKVSHRFLFPKFVSFWRWNNDNIDFHYILRGLITWIRNTLRFTALRIIRRDLSTITKGILYGMNCIQLKNRFHFSQWEDYRGKRKLVLRTDIRRQILIKANLS
jgi:hypothetical protein